MPSLLQSFHIFVSNLYNRLRGVQQIHFLPENSGLTPRQIETGVKALKVLGIDGSSISKNDLVIYLYAVGLNPTDDVIDSKLRAFKLHNYAEYTFGQVCHIWQSMLQDLTDEEEILKRAFEFFDKDGNGEISIPELRTTMHELGDLLSEEEIMAFMAVMDVNNDGVIGFQEFLDTLKTQTPELIPSNNMGQSQYEAEGRRNDMDYSTGKHMAINMQNPPALVMGQPVSEGTATNKWRVVHDVPEDLQRAHTSEIEIGRNDSLRAPLRVNTSSSFRSPRIDDQVVSSPMERLNPAGNPNVADAEDSNSPSRFDRRRPKAAAALS